MISKDMVRVPKYFMDIKNKVKSHKDTKYAKEKREGDFVFFVF